MGNTSISVESDQYILIIFEIQLFQLILVKLADFLKFSCFTYEFENFSGIPMGSFS